MDDWGGRRCSAAWSPASGGIIGGRDSAAWRGTQHARAAEGRRDFHIPLHSRATREFVTRPRIARGFQRKVRSGDRTYLQPIWRSAFPSRRAAVQQIRGAALAWLLRPPGGCAGYIGAFSGALHARNRGYVRDVSRTRTATNSSSACRHHPWICCPARACSAASRSARRPCNRAHPCDSAPSFAHCN